MRILPFLMRRAPPTPQNERASHGDGPDASVSPEPSFGPLPSLATNSTESTRLWREDEPRRRATAIFDALMGGVFGMHVDERRLFAALDGLPPGGLVELREQYQSLYGRVLDDDLAGTLRGSTRVRAGSILQGRANEADAESLKQALRGLTPKFGGVFSVLERARAEGRTHAVSAAYQSLVGRPLVEDLKKKSRGDTEARAVALLAGHGDEADAIAVHAMLRSLTRTSSSSLESLCGTLRRSPDAIAEAYRVRFDEDLETTIRSRLGGEADRVLSVLRRDRPGELLVQVDAVLRSQGDKLSLHRLLPLLAAARAIERTQLQSRYVQVHQRTLRADLVRKAGEDRALAIDALLQSGELPDATRVHFALDLHDAADLLDILRERDAAGIAALAKELRATWGTDLHARVRREFSGIARGELELALKGTPQTLDDVVEVLRARHALSRGGGRNDLARALLDRAIHLQAGPLSDKLLHRFEVALAEAVKDGLIDDHEWSNLAALWQASHAHLARYDNERTMAREALGAVASIALSTTAGVLAPPTAAPMAITAMRTAAALTGVLGVRIVVGGRSYDPIDVARDALKGIAITAAATAGAQLFPVVASGAREHLQQLGQGVLSAVGIGPTQAPPAAAVVAGQWLVHLDRAAAIASRSLQGAINGGISTAVATAAGEGMSRRTWLSGLPSGLRAIAGTGMRSIPRGAMTSAGLTAAQALPSSHVASTAVAVCADLVLRLVRLAGTTRDDVEAHISQIVTGDGETILFVGAPRGGSIQLSGLSRGAGAGDGLPQIYIVDGAQDGGPVQPLARVITTGSSTRLVPVDLDDDGTADVALGEDLAAASAQEVDAVVADHTELLIALDEILSDPVATIAGTDLLHQRRRELLVRFYPAVYEELRAVADQATQHA